MIMDTPKPKTDIAPKKRKRSRSRSLTPPPELPVHRLMNARNVVRQALQAGGRAPSPTFVGDDSTDTIVLDPELLKIAEEVKKRTGPSTLINQNRGPEDVIMRVKWQPHPLDEAARSETWAYKMKRQSNFIELFDEVADAATVLVDRLFITYEGKRIYSSATPHNLKVWAEGELEACEQATYEYLRTHRHQPTPPTRQPEAAARSPSAAPLESDAESDAGSQTDDKFRLILRSSATKDITLTVRPTTTCGAIVKAFLKKAGLSDRSVPSSAKGPKKKTASVPHLVIDGDKMLPDTAIGDADLEDGDQVEVVGL
ncbi:hypothetical protein CONPUDRAFT_72760 [Coniophora puteana RWD-64-598 SS2]|uniref:Uncharacterized protein n=1 Tax=Coniophora puteana (strain RWD-64-598) TaxID=741705 RepID=A0A5M3MQA6_CONPW|nr:uncharacterized protein CONPUDRAFT_72760 [Coniophora puteana RWD-64-598 SS2]EIW80894.1 hypothetical protein CONPUDRAFT_72760 [Coniophora puteana RWD-64-598 SS2]